MENCSLKVTTRESQSPVARTLFHNQEGNPIDGTDYTAKAELALQEEQLSHYQKKAAAWKGATIKNKKIAAAHSHAAGEESFISSSDMKRYEGWSIFGDLHNGGKLFSAKFISSQ